MKLFCTWILVKSEQFCKTLLKIIELYNLNSEFNGYVNSISVKLFVFLSHLALFPTWIWYEWGFPSRFYAGLKSTPVCRCSVSTPITESPFTYLILYSLGNSTEHCPEKPNKFMSYLKQLMYHREYIRSFQMNSI